MTKACVFFGISRKIYYKWRNRYAASQGDRLSLADRSRRPHRHPRQVGARMARRKQMDVRTVERWLSPNLNYDPDSPGQ